MGTSPEESGDSGCVFHVRHRSWKSNAIKIHRPPNSENWSRQGGTMCVYMYVPTYRRHHCGQVHSHANANYGLFKPTAPHQQGLL